MPFLLMCACLSAPCLTKCLQMVVHVCLSSHALVFSPVDLYLVVVGELLIKQILFTCVLYALPFQWNPFWVKNKSCKRIWVSVCLAFTRGGVVERKNTPKKLEVLVSSLPQPEVWIHPHFAGCTPCVVKIMSSVNGSVIQTKWVHWIHSYYFS